MEQTKLTDTIVAVSTPPGSGGIAVIRVSGPDAVKVVGKLWSGKNLAECKSHTAHLGKICNESGEVIDEVVATLFLAPNSFTGEEIVEISCHGSRWIQREIVNTLVRVGCRGAEPGEFSKRAFLNGRIDLAQAEGIIDLISSSSRAAHRLALQQANGQFSSKLNSLREQLVEFASLLELELDFSEEDVEFADRSRLTNLADKIITEVSRLANSYAAGKAFKEGIPVVIAGEPNAGKSTLLNFLLEEDKAIVSNIPGTTRDIIEDTRELGGILFRFVDTAGLRQTDDTVEKIGIQRASDRLQRAAFILWIVDTSANIDEQLKNIAENRKNLPQDIKHFILYNKADISHFQLPSTTAADTENDSTIDNHTNKVFTTKTDDLHQLDDSADLLNNETKSFVISANSGEGLEKIIDKLVTEAAKMQTSDDDIMVTNARHYEALIRGGEALTRARTALADKLSADFVAQDVREALHFLSEITGTISSTTLLHSIFSRFCIGK